MKKRTYQSFDKKLNEIEYISIKDRKGIEYCDNIMAFDIETTSAFYFQNSLEAYNSQHKEEYTEKYSLCYFWSFCIDGYCFYGRTLEDFLYFLLELESLTVNLIKIIYVHNLSFEFQFLRNVFTEMKVFARKIRKPLYFTWKNYEFRCSYMLTNQSLEMWAKTHNLSHHKLVGDLDYNVIRTPYTSMTDKEIQYGLVDSIIVVEGIQQFKKQYKHVYRIPLTQTGIVRREVNNLLMKETKLHKKILNIYPTELDEYKTYVNLFSGGYTHANRLWADTTLLNLYSRDRTSAYPWEMISNQYPNSKFIPTKKIDIIMDNPDMTYYCTVSLYGVESLFWNSYISISHCRDYKDVVCDNGRIISAKYLKLTVLDVDLNIIQKSYKIDDYQIEDLNYATKDYFPDKFRKYILTLFNNKTSLKDIKEYEDLYMRSKEQLNSLYGMMVTKNLTDDIIFDNDWQIDRLTNQKFYKKIDEELDKFYKLNFIYSQGIYIPAYQRSSLWEGVLHHDEDIVYMDTDSHKYISTPDNEQFYKQYNSDIRHKQEQIASDLNISIDLLRPLSPKGIECSLGEYVLEDIYPSFKTLGAKRYANTDKNNQICITVSGVNKNKGKTQITNLEDFKDGLVFDEEHCGKSLITYLDNMNNIWYNKGKIDQFYSKYQYGICSEPTTYQMNLTGEYHDLISALANTRTKLFVND